jgi:hypothetical protein
VPTVEVRGAEQLAALAKRLKDAGEKDLRRDLMTALTKSTEQLRKRSLPASARRTLPRKGGLNELVARSKMTSTRRTSGRQAGLRVVARNPNLQLRKLDEGQVRHPVFARGGRPRVWVRQSVRPGWFTIPTETAAPGIRAEVEQAMTTTAARIEGTTR